MQNESSGTNTVLIVLLIALVVAGLVWFMRGGLPANDGASDINVDLSLPTGGAGSESAN